MASKVTTSVSLNKRTIFDCLNDPKAAAALPSLESVLSELQALTSQNHARLDDLIRLVEADQGMSIRVLRMANSVYFAPSEPIMEVQEAVLYIGLSAFRGLVVSSRCIEKTCHVRQSVLHWSQFWTHAAGVGWITRELSQYLREVDQSAESYYLMGLLHDIGKVVLAQLMPEEFDRIYTRAAREKVAVHLLEHEILGVEHGHLGAWYMHKQRIPLALCEPVRLHHATGGDNSAFYNSARLIRLADHFAHWLELGQSGNRQRVEDPFALPEWEWFTSQTRQHSADLKQEITQQMLHVTEMVNAIICD